MANKQDIIEALKKLDPADDSVWTDDGLPKTSVVQKLANDPAIKRGDINDAFPGFSRETAAAPAADETGAAPAAPAAQAEAPAQAAESERQDAAGLTAGDWDRILSQREKAVTDAQEAILTAQRELVKAQKALDQARLDKAKEFPPLHPSDAIKQHLERQKEEAALRMSQIDMAMSGRRSFGWGRPNRGKMVAAGR